MTPPRLLATALMVFATAAANAADAPAPGHPFIEFSAEANHPAANDMVVAIMYTEQSGAEPAALARQVNKTIAGAIESARGQSDVKLQSAGTSTWPVYGKGSGGSAKIDGWRMRSELRLESRNAAAVSELIGKLQANLALAQVNMQPAAETRRKASDQATIDALRAFEQRATLISSAMGKRYRIRQLSISDASHQPVFARMRAAAPMMAEAAPAPLEGGESQVAVTVNGSIDLID